MIVRKDKSFETNSMFLNTNWYDNEDNYVVDETTEEGQALANKIREHYPYFDIVIENNQLVDIIPTERPPEPDPEPSLEEKMEIKLAESTAETVNLMYELQQAQALEQAQSNAEMVELIMSLGGAL